MNQDVRRVVLTGPECTGKSTLAVRLAAELRAPLLTESARTYADEVTRELGVEDVERIARRAVATEDTLLATHPTTIICDTDLLSTVVYGRHYYGFHSEWLEREARSRLGSLYLLCHPDVPWVRDGVRDRPTNRDQMFDEFRSMLAEFGAKVAEIRGTGEARFDAAWLAVSRASSIPRPPHRNG